MTHQHHVLIVEDERLLGEAMCDFLGDFYRADLVTTVAAAVQRLRDDPSIEIILCDVGLPDGTAAHVFAAYCAAWPDRGNRFVFLSGGTNDPSVRDLLATQRYPVVRKPFDLDDLPALIERQASLAGLR
jgi:DNA-binding response OmpR family regulator